MTRQGKAQHGITWQDKSRPVRARQGIGGVRQEGAGGGGGGGSTVLKDAATGARRGVGNLEGVL